MGDITGVFGEGHKILHDLFKHAVAFSVEIVVLHALCGGNSCRVGHKIKRDILRIPGQAAAAF